MMTGKELKRLVSIIPDDAAVTINGGYDVDIVEVSVEGPGPFCSPSADLKLTQGYTITKDSVLDKMFRPDKFKDVETR